MSFVPSPCPFDPAEPDAETRANFALLNGSDGNMRCYWRLAVETAQHISKLEHLQGRSLGPRWFEVEGADFAVYCLEQLSEIEESPALIRRWKDWGEQYELIAKRSPKWRLKAMISDISETHSYLSWPKRWERDIWEWAIKSGDTVACPFVDSRGLIDPNFRQRLHDTVKEVDGFLYYCEEAGQIVFAPTEQLEQIWWHQDHLAAIDRDKPFGFFHDASRPNFTMRPPTEGEERMLAAIRPPAHRERGWARHLRRIFSALIR